MPPAAQGKGRFLPVPVLPLSGTIRVEVVNDETGVCFESLFSSATTKSEKKYRRALTVAAD